MNFLEVMGAIFCVLLILLGVPALILVLAALNTPAQRDGWQDADPRPRRKE